MFRRRLLKHLLKHFSKYFLKLFSKRNFLLKKKFYFAFEYALFYLFTKNFKRIIKKTFNEKKIDIF